MKRLLAVALVVLLAGCSSSGPADVEPKPTKAAFASSKFAACPAAAGSAPADSPLRSVEPLLCMDPSGKKVTIGAPTGHPVVLNLWGSWCPPCGKEMPAFVRLAASAGDRVSVVGVNTADDASRAVAAADELDVRFANVFDRGEEVRKALGVNALPATAFVSAAGEVVHVHRGTPLTDATLNALVRQHLGVTVE
ncbi:TlpA family protein disulfide reductase [Cryptosporangium arvum]|uniref:Thiol-disulfide isomerase-like thioredoxin n=1 Tax=Cryptosporangium arvum DSM 44712 TaxID=927661 RepID=A0A010ZPZ5_9ACTN|nr:TlpA disulfide reductase family protein [Cryptosporangium arvum]EXG79252.1 thiol-disulfide isomerase-like thioredoxin [Cryptosporangium arvum DSM 44712]